MSDAPAYKGLRQLIRSSGKPEVITNDLLHSLLLADRPMYTAFLDALGSTVGRPLAGCSIEREAPDVDAVTGKVSYRDFLLRDTDGLTRCIVETKVDQALTSEDQASRYLGQLPDDGVLVLVTRRPLLASLAVQVSSQLGVVLAARGSVHTGVAGRRAVVVMPWSRLLLDPVDPEGRRFTELVALEAALEGISTFVPFTTAVQDVALGRTVHQVVEVARRVCGRLAEEIERAGVRVDAVGKVIDRGHDVFVEVTILGHEFWVGYDTAFWVTVPGDPGNARAGASGGLPPSPLWINRYAYRPTRAATEPEAARRARLDALGIARPLPIPLGAPKDAVVDAVLSDAVAHIGRVSRALHADADAVAGD